MTNVVELAPEMEEQDDGMWPAISLLLKRMETHPEEFEPPKGRGISKWTPLISELQDVATPEDFAPLKAKLYEIRMGGLYAKVVENLCRDAEEPDYSQDARLYTAKAIGQADLTQSQLNQYSALQQLQNYQNQQTLALGNGGIGSTAVEVASGRNSLFRGLLGSK